MRNTTRISSITLAGSFIMYTMFLYLIRPSIVKTINKDNKVVVKWQVLLSLSLAFACMTTIVVFFYMVNRRNVAGTTYMADKIKFVPKT